MLVLQTTALSKCYGSRLAVDSLDMELESGTVTGFVGPNGAGKTTTMKMLLGLIAPSGGGGTVLGQSLRHPSRYLKDVGALIEAPAFYPKLSGERNLLALARLDGIPRARVREVIATVRLQSRARDQYRSYSLGMKQRLGLAAALLPDPRLLILDEPTNGLDPAGIREMRALMRALADSGKTILVSSHLLGEIESVCDRLLLINAGRVRFQGTVKDMLAEREVTELHATPEHPEDVERLLAVLAAAGLEARREDGGVVLLARETYAADLNRHARDAGITLSALYAIRVSLEDVYFAMTGSEVERPL